MSGRMTIKTLKVAVWCKKCLLHKTFNVHVYFVPWKKKRSIVFAKTKQWTTTPSGYELRKKENSAPLEWRCRFLWLFSKLLRKSTLFFWSVLRVGAGFWSGRPSRVLTSRGGALSPNFAQNGGFPLTLPGNCMILKKILGARGNPAPQSPPGSGRGSIEHLIEGWHKSGSIQFHPRSEHLF